MSALLCSRMLPSAFCVRSLLSSHCVACALAAEPPPVHSPLSPQESLQAYRRRARPEGRARRQRAERHRPRRHPLRRRRPHVGRRNARLSDRLADERVRSSRISVLDDNDGDGFFETATVFADDLPFATGLQPWKGGVFVTLAGQVAYMKDTDGDGKADVDETWFTGFAEGNTQLRANHPRARARQPHLHRQRPARRQDRRRPPAGREARFDQRHGFPLRSAHAASAKPSPASASSA